MPADSLIRRISKHALFPLLSERSYRIVQAAVKAWDIAAGEWREPELDLVPLALRPGETAVDVGANFGLYAYHLSRAVGRHGRVIAFEPVPFTAATLRVVARILRLKNVRVVERGLADVPRIAVMSVPVQTSGALVTGLAHVAERDAPARAPEGPTRTFECELVRLDDYLDPLDRPALLKLDVEGAELSVLRGGEQVIERARPVVVCELCPPMLARFDCRLADVWAFFRAHGYQAFRYDPAARRLIAVRDDGHGGGNNYVVVPPERLERLRRVMPGWPPGARYSRRSTSASTS